MPVGRFPGSWGRAPGRLEVGHRTGKVPVCEWCSGLARQPPSQWLLQGNVPSSSLTTKQLPRKVGAGGLCIHQPEEALAVRPDFRQTLTPDEVPEGLASKPSP